MKNQSIQIELWNDKIIKLNLYGCYIKFLEKPKDITAIEIKNSDNIGKDISFLKYDYNYIKYGYKIYNDRKVFSIEHPLGKSAYVAPGKIIGIDDFEFEHDISTDQGSSGCPIILLNDDLNSIFVIGIHKGAITKDINGGTFIGEIIKEIEKDFTFKNIDNINKGESIMINNINYIIGEIYIKNEDINKDIRIINSYEEFNRTRNNNEAEEKLKNEQQIKESKIQIDNQIISFNYCYKFEKEGKHIIKYIFKNNLTNINHLFFEC